MYRFAAWLVHHGVVVVEGVVEVRVWGVVLVGEGGHHSGHAGSVVH